MLVDLNQVPALALIDVADGVVRVGAIVPAARPRAPCRGARRLPAAAAGPALVGHVATRNRGTVGGSIAHADAAAELPLLLQTLAGEVEVDGAAGARLVPAEDLFVSHLTSCLEPDELVTEVRFPVGGAGGARASPRSRRATATTRVCAVACALRVEDGVVARGALGAGAVSDRPLRLRGAEARSWARRCEPRRARGRRRGGARARRSERRHARLGRVPPPPRGRARRRAAQRAYAMAAAVRELALTVNGRGVHEHVDDRLLLSDFLRHELGLRGTHVGCEHGVCGACTVRLDGRAVRSCLLLAAQAEGCHVETVEALAEPDGPLSRCRRRSGGTTPCSAASVRPASS